MTRAGLLFDHLRAYRGQRFEWSSCNCATFAGAWVLRATGRDVLAGLQADSALGWSRVVRELGGLRSAVTARMTGGEILPTLARMALSSSTVSAAKPPPRRT